MRSSPWPGPASADYVVSVDGALEELTVHLCSPGAWPPRLMPGTPAGARDVVVTRIGPDKAVQTLPIEGGRLSTAGMPAGSCLRFVFDLEAVDAASREGAPDASVRWIWPALWLWRPESLSNGWTATLRFDGPPDAHLSAPWPKNASGRRELAGSAFTTRARVLIGRFPQWIEPVAGARLEVAAVGPLPDRGLLGPWLQVSARGVGAIFGRFPQPGVQVVLRGLPGRGIHFGAALRGGGPAVTLWVGRDSTAEDLRADWTLAHELFHLGMPWVPVEAAWFAEGVTQYYSHIAQARGGALSAEAAWAELVDGFGRGRGAHRGLSVVAESEALAQRRNYWWVYWGGAAWALRLDIALRRRGSSLDAVVRHWSRHPCCDAPRPVAALLAEADALTGYPVSDISILQVTEFPDVSAELAWLGVVSEGPVVRLDPSAPGAAVARAIMGVESPPPAR